MPFCMEDKKKSYLIHKIFAYNSSVEDRHEIYNFVSDSPTVEPLLVSGIPV